MASRQKARKLPHTRSILSVPFPVEEMRRVVQAAASVGESVSGFVRASALRRANEINGPKAPSEVPAVATA